MNFESLTQEEVGRVLQAVPKAVQAGLQTERVVLAGGVIRDTLAGLPVKDIDIFCHSEMQAQKLAFRVSPFVRHTTFAYTVAVEGKPVQFVFYKDFDDARDLVGQFDFRACCAGISWDSWYPGNGEFEGVAVEGFHADCRDRVLHFMSQEKDADKLTALRRALDFAKKGWSISNAELAAILAHWAGGPSGPDDAKQPAECAARKVQIVRAFRPAYGGKR